MVSTRKMAITGVTTDIGADVNGTFTEPPTVVVLRADMDALPIHEETDLEFKSEIDGVMHACTFVCPVNMEGMKHNSKTSCSIESNMVVIEHVLSCACVVLYRWS